MKSTRRLTTLAMFISAALVLHVVEGMLPVPFITVPGIKLGLANIVTLMAIIFFGFKDVIMIVVIRCLMGSLFGGSISAFLFSVTGGVLSAIIMWLFYKKLGKYFSIIGVSTVGALFHNVGQLLMASIIIGDIRIYGYLPLLMVSSVVTGLFIGLVCSYAKKPVLNNISKLGLNFNKK